ncbi:unnamed protein product [Toxocara canis]|uniref:START domain-containing protein n=1 Tax=Toxocara canis TaxID=6265 RepID=A0A183UXH5_TOXCA|nr:unnamed protein product [Toxocara canis]
MARLLHLVDDFSYRVIHVWDIDYPETVVSLGKEKTFDVSSNRKPVLSVCMHWPHCHGCCSSVGVLLGCASDVHIVEASWLELQYPKRSRVAVSVPQMLRGTNAYVVNVLCDIRSSSAVN